MTKTFNVPVVFDIVTEPSEYVFVELSSPVNAQVSKTRGEVTVTIIDDGCPPTIC